MKCQACNVFDHLSRYMIVAQLYTRNLTGLKLVLARRIWAMKGECYAHIENQRSIIKSWRKRRRS